MKSAMLIVSGIVLLTTVASCGKHSLRGEGSIITDTRSLSNFTRIEANGSTDITIVKDSVYKVVLTGYQNLVPVYETKLSGNKLTLEFNDKYFNIRNNNIFVEVHTPNVEYFSQNGSGDAVMNGSFNGNSMEAKINGSGSITVNNSTFTTFKADVNGSGDILASSTVCDNGYANLSGSGNIELNVKKNLYVKISGSGNVRYWGNPTTDIDISGSGNVKKKG